MMAKYREGGEKQSKIFREAYKHHDDKVLKNIKLRFRKNKAENTKNHSNSKKQTIKEK